MGGSRDDVQKFFEQWSQTYDHPAYQENIYRPLQEVLHRHLKIAAGGGRLECVLDVGLGTGQSLGWLPDVARRVVGLDYSMDMLGHARTRCSQGQALVCGSATDLPLADACMDAVVSCFSIHWWPDIAAGLREVARVLRPGAHAFIMIPTAASLGVTQSPFRTPGPQQKVQWIPPSRYGQMARAAGMTTRLPKEVARGAWLLQAQRPGP